MLGRLCLETLSSTTNELNCKQSFIITFFLFFLLERQKEWKTLKRGGYFENVA